MQNLNLWKTLRKVSLQQLKNKKSIDQANALAEQMIAAVNEGAQSVEEFASNHDLDVVNARDVARTGSSQPFRLVNGVFALGRPGDSEPSLQVIEANGSDVAVVKLLAVKDVDLDGLEDTAADSAQLGRNIKNNEQQLMLQALRESASVSVNEDLLNQVDNL